MKSDGISTNTVEIYCPLSQTWSTGKPMLTARKGAKAAVIKGKLYVIGGKVLAM